MLNRKTLLLSLIGLSSGRAFAAEADTTAAAGMAGAGVANTSDNAAIRRNPAAMVLEDSYIGQLDFGFPDGWRLQTSVKDTHTSLFGAGLSYTRNHFSPDVSSSDMPGWVLPDEEITNDTAEESYRVGAGLADEDRMKALGVGLVWDRKNEELRGISHAIEADASAAARLGARWTLGVIARDVLPETPDNLVGSRPWSAEAGAWLAAAEWMGIAADGIWQSEGEFGARLGTQLAAGESVRLRAGGAWIDGQWTAAGGFGAYSEQAAFHYSAQLDVSEASFQHSIGVSVEF